MKYQNALVLFLSSKRPKRMAALGISIVFAVFLTFEFFSTAAPPNGENGAHNDPSAKTQSGFWRKANRPFVSTHSGTMPFGAIHSGSAKPWPSSRLTRLWHWA